MKTTIATALAALCLCALALPVSAQETGRTDGPEESEYTTGGYPFGGPAGKLYISPSFGTGVFDVGGLGSQSGLLYGIDFGYEMDSWIGLQGGYSYLADRKMSIFGLGSRLSYTAEPFLYYTTVTAGLYAPEGGSRRFGLAPGAGIEIAFHERFRVGLDYKHDFIFEETETQHLDRIYAGLRFYF